MARYRKNGCRVFYAVDRMGERVKQLILLPATDEDDAVAYLWRYLNHVDPGLRLVRELPPARPATPVLDPYADDQQYRRKLVQAGARKLRFFRD